MRYVLVLLALAACDQPPVRKLPGADLAPHLRSRTPPAACGIDVTYDEGVVRYRHDFDERGRVAVATGRVGADIVESVAYEWDHLGHLVHLRQTSTYGGAGIVIVAQYDTLGDLLEYTWTHSAPGYQRAQRYAYSDFSDGGLPAREEITLDGETRTFRLAYDANGRIVATTPEGEGPTTIYTYDDAARTITIDSDGGAVRGVFAFDAEDRQLSETWDGTAPGTVASADLFEWDGDRLLTITHRSGTPAQPRELRTVAVDTYRYDCDP